MGWVKYYKDNVSICIDRMNMLDSVSVTSGCIKIEVRPAKKEKVNHQKAEKIEMINE